MIKRNYNQSEWEFERSRLDPTRFWWLVNGADRRDFHGQVRVQDWMLTASLQRNNMIAIVPQEFWDVLSVNSETRTGFRWHLDLQTPRKLCVSTTGLLSLEGSLGHESQLLLSLHLLSNSVTVPSVLLDEKNVHVWKQPARFMAYMPMIHHYPSYDQARWSPFCVFLWAKCPSQSHLHTPKQQLCPGKVEPIDLDPDQLSMSLGARGWILQNLSKFCSWT